MIVKPCLATSLLILAGFASAARAEFRIQPGWIAACAGTFTDSGGPSGDYAHGETFIQTIWPGLYDSRVMLSFTSFSTEATADSLTISNGHNHLAPIVTDASGALPPFSVASTAADGSLTVVWHSNGSIAGSGWVATISCLPLEQRMRDAEVKACEGTFTDSGGAGNYSVDENLVLTLQSTAWGAYPEVHFEDVDIEISYDLLKVYDGLTTASPLLATLTGTTVPPPIVATNADRALTFHFDSDLVTNNSGWFAQILCGYPVSFLGPADSCFGLATDSGGSGGNYQDNENFLVRTYYPTEPSAKLELDFLDFDTEAGFDFLWIYDGNSTSAPSLGVYHGSGDPGVFTSTASDGSLTLEWFSDTSNTGAGWRALLSCVHPIAAGTIATCLTRSVDTGGAEGPYDNSETLVQSFIPRRPWARMGAYFPEFASEPVVDRLRILDGAAGSPELGLLSGLPTLPVSYATTHPESRLTLDWLSNGSATSSGWSAIVGCIPPLFADGFEGRDLAQWSASIP